MSSAFCKQLASLIVKPDCPTFDVAYTNGQSGSDSSVLVPLHYAVFTTQALISQVGEANEGCSYLVDIEFSGSYAQNVTVPSTYLHYYLRIEPATDLVFEPVITGSGSFNHTFSLPYDVLSVPSTITALIQCDQLIAAGLPQTVNMSLQVTVNVVIP